jgi:hypothetical protein
MVHTRNPSCSSGGDRRIKVGGQSGQKLDTLSEKQTKKKRTGSVAEVVQHLPNKQEALSSILSTKK